jgi:GTPase KRas protein
MRGTTDFPKIVVGTNCHLVNKRQVKLEDARELCRHYGCPVIEASARADINVNEIFYSLIDQLWASNNYNLKTKPKVCKSCN